MRSAACLLALVSIAAAPLRARAADEDRFSPPARPERTDAYAGEAVPDDPAPAEAAPPRARAAPVPPEARPGPYPRAPSPYPRTGRPPYPRAVPPHYPPPAHAERPRVVVGPPPFWWGWGWGWGYYPLYPRYPLAPGDQSSPPTQTSPAYPAPDPDRIVTRLSLHGAGMRRDLDEPDGRDDGYAAGLALTVDGRQVGFHAGVDAVARESVTGDFHDDGSSPAAWATAHITWSVLSRDAYRLRFELGGSLLALPDDTFAAGQPWAGKVIFGPDVGVSGQLGLVGPIGIEGHARVTPFPVPVVDTRIALALRGGPLGITLGWRAINVEGDDQDTDADAPELRFRGPELGLSVAF